MRPTLATGLTGSANHEVTTKWSTDHAFHPVLATPSMIGLIEWVCFDVTKDHLDEGEVTGPRGRVSQGTHKRAVLAPPPG